MHGGAASWTLFLKLSRGGEDKTDGVSPAVLRNVSSVLVWLQVLSPAGRTCCWWWWARPSSPSVCCRSCPRVHAICCWSKLTAALLRRVSCMRSARIRNSIAGLLQNTVKSKSQKCLKWGSGASLCLTRQHAIMLIAQNLKKPVKLLFIFIRHFNGIN